jgi:DeoR/GlpR family transcriptional regulator of sugar metabolism
VTNIPTIHGVCHNLLKLPSVDKNHQIFYNKTAKIFSEYQKSTKESRMTTYERRQSVLGILRKQPGLRIPELAQALDVSEGTIRNDLNALETEGKLRRVHGGAVLNEQNPFLNNSFMRRYRQNVAAKSAIARKASTLIKDRDSILLDASSTAYYLARALSARNKLRVMTNGFEVARELARNTSNTVMLIGGVVENDSSSVTGLLSEQIIADMRVEKSFFSCSGFSIERGMTEVHLGEAQLKRKAIESSKQVFGLIDSSKFGKEDLTTFARPNQIAQIFTDSGITDEWQSRLQEAGISFWVCDDTANL